MNLPLLDRSLDEVIPRGDAYSRQVVKSRFRFEPVAETDSAAIALEMVSDAAEAIRQLEEQSAEAVTRARDVADSIVKKLEFTEARAERAEAALRQAEDEVAELSTTASKAFHDLETTRQQLSTKDEQLAATEERLRVIESQAKDAEQRALEANAAIERIMDAIRTQLPARAI
jgi:chromosome segregation ATPase